MEGNFTKDSFPFQMMGDYYKLVKDFWKTEEKKEYWVEAVEKAEEFSTKYEKQSLGFSRKIALEYLNFLDRKYKERKLKN